MPQSQQLDRTRLRGIAQQHPLWLIAVGVVMYGSGPVFVAASSISGPVFSFWRLWFGVGVIGAATAIAVRLGGTRWPRGWSSWRWAVVAGLAFGVHQLAFFSAVQMTSVADVQLMSTVAPLVTAIVAVPLFGERMTRWFLAWTVLAIAGAAIVAMGGASGPDGNPIGMALASSNVVLFSAFYLLSKRGRDEIDVLPFLLGVMFFAALATTAWCVLAGEPVISSPDSYDLTLAAIVALGPGAIGHFVMTWPLKWVPANVPPVMRLSQPLVGGLLAWAWLSQPITNAHLMGGALTLFGVFGALASRLPKDTEPGPQPG